MNSLYNSKIRNILLLVLVLCITVNLYSQKLINSRQTSYYTYIYKISDDEARKIYEEDISIVDSSYFHNLVDSFPTDKKFEAKLHNGHYLRTFADKNLQKFEITTVQDFNIYILNNNSDLCIQVFDLEGNLINNADVYIKRKKLTFDKKTKSYLHRKSNKKGLLTVIYNKSTAYYNLSRDYNNSFIRRNTRKVVYGIPVRYVWIPINYVIHLPIDGIKSIYRGWSYGTIARSKRFFIRLYEKVACIFDDYYCDDNSYDKFINKHTGYIVFNKAKYMPKDTVKFKAYISTKKGRAIKKQVKVILQSNGKDVNLTKLLPYRPGAYKYEFYLHDSLQLKLDRTYRIRLELEDPKVYINDYFVYEDYELSKTALAVRLENKTQYKNKPNAIYVKGTDENELNLMDARIEVLASPTSINKNFDKYTFVADTLFYIEKPLNKTGETKILLPDSTFPKSNFDYKVKVTMLNSDNEIISKSINVAYYYKSQNIDIQANTDSVFIKYLKNGIDTTKDITVYAQDNFGNKTKVYSGKTPHRIKINPYYASYLVKSDSIEATHEISQYSSMIKCLSERTTDSIYLVVNNPLKIPFIYNIYKKNSQKYCGYTDSLNIKKRTKTKQNYFVSIRYIWGGREHEDSYRIPLIDKKLNIEVTQPKIVYPGQKTKIEVLVTDVNRKPVEGVDLTAFSLTKKFNYSVPQVPYWGKTKKDKVVINNFSIDNKSDESTSLKLNYGLWKSLAGLDSIEYYKFMYPGNNIYRFEYNSEDSITQFAPFVVSEGKNSPVHVVYVDNEPVFFSWATNIRPYSFRIDSGYHQIELRTLTREIIFDSIYFNPRKKLIICVDKNIRNKNVSVFRVKPELSDYKRRLFAKYTIPYRNNFGVHYAILENDDKLQMLNSRFYRGANNLLGPITGKLKFNLIDSFSIMFNHEPFFEYEFEPNLIKMRSTKLDNYPRYLSNYKTYSNLTDFVFTKQLTQNRWKDYINQRRYTKAIYNYPINTENGAGRLQIKFKDKKHSDEMQALNILMFKHDDSNFLRVYPGNIKNMHNLKQAYYKLIFFYPDAKYHIEDSVYISPDGLNIYEFEQAEVCDKDPFSMYVSNIIEKSIFQDRKSTYEQKTELGKIKLKYVQSFHNLSGIAVEGYVYDEFDEALPGATVTVEGTDYGTTTNIDGHYSIKVPPGYYSLNFSYIGYGTVSKTISSDVMDVKLTDSELDLEEVVVTGYGYTRKRSYTASISTVQAESIHISKTLRGRVAGLQILKDSISGGIKIRGSSTIELSKEPLYVIDGNIFAGDISKLNHNNFISVDVLKSEAATALYGSRAANGVVIFQTKTGKYKSNNINSKGAELDFGFIKAASQSNSIRSNFSDYAFWQPSLTTDKNGKASFDVQFPDDVTGWETFYLAVSDKRQSGQSQGIIKSYKPFMAQIAHPRFLIEGDTANAIGKVLNYTSDSIKLKTILELEDSVIFSKSRYCTTSLIDTLLITPKNDSVAIKYYIKTDDNYFDGEKRNIPVFKKGVETTFGNFYVLDKDTSIQLNFDKSKGKVHLYARADVISIIEDEIKHVTSYKYLCNEQLASKLKAYLAQKAVCNFKSEKFKSDKKIKKIIKLIEDRQRKSGIWGWWENSANSYWISLHVLEALINAKQYYSVNIDYDEIAQMLVWELKNSKEFYRSIRIMRILGLCSAKINYKKYIEKLDTCKEMSLNKLLNIIRVKQLHNIDYKLDTLNFYKKTTMFGNIYYSDKDNAVSLHDNDMQNTLLAYNILSADSLEHKADLNKISNYFLEKRQNSYWRNTYESAQIIESILPNLLKGKTKVVKSKLNLSGSVDKHIDKFPFAMQVNPSDNITISKSGNMPLYFTAYQRYHSIEAKSSNENFEISSSFDKSVHSTLKAGKAVKLITKVKVKKDAEYLMINIPIPGGCSYANKNNNYQNEAHREYYKNETSIFCTYLAAGNYSFEIELIPRYTGAYTLNPAKVELMYFPTFNANNKIKTIRIN